jgi:poly-beta-hydroxybutyrate-responsive repressor
MCNDLTGNPGRCRKGQVSGLIQPRLLLRLAQKPAHGYKLMEVLGQSEDAPPDPGSFYRTLRSLEDEGLVQSTWDTSGAGAARRVYELTDQGLEFLHAWAVTIQQTHQSLSRFLSDYETLFPQKE